MNKHYRLIIQDRNIYVYMDGEIVVEGTEASSGTKMWTLECKGTKTVTVANQHEAVRLALRYIQVTFDPSMSPHLIKSFP